MPEFPFDQINMEFNARVARESARADAVNAILQDIYNETKFKITVEFGEYKSEFVCIPSAFNRTDTSFGGINLSLHAQGHKQLEKK